MSKHKPAVSGSQSLPLTLLTLPDSSDTTVTLCESETEGLIFTPSLTVSEAVSESLQLTPLTPVNVTPFTDFQPSLNHSESVHSLELDTADSDTSTQSPSPHPELERCFSPDLFSDEEHKEHSTDTDSDSSTLPSSPTFTLKRSLWRNKVDRVTGKRFKIELREDCTQTDFPLFTDDILLYTENSLTKTFINTDSKKRNATSVQTIIRYGFDKQTSN